MELIDKIKILADSAKYDVSCSSSGSDRKNKKGGIGNAAPSGICHSWTPDGRCISLLKILFTNYCIYDCKYCVNRCSNDIPRASFTPEELVNLTINFYRRNYIEGLFLSSAVWVSPDHTMEQLLKSVKKLREEVNFNGYIHLKAIPGANSALIEEAGRYVDRMSVNIELPSINNPPLLREHRLYHADWLLRFYGFTSNEILDDNNPNFDELLDPKSDWALRNLDRFPVEVNKADYYMLLRVPGIGVKSAQRILQTW